MSVIWQNNFSWGFQFEKKNSYQVHLSDIMIKMILAAKVLFEHSYCLMYHIYKACSKIGGLCKFNGNRRLTFGKYIKLTIKFIMAVLSFIVEMIKNDLKFITLKAKEHSKLEHQHQWIQKTDSSRILLQNCHRTLWIFFISIFSCDSKDPHENSYLFFRISCCVTSSKYYTVVGLIMAHLNSFHSTVLLSYHQMCIHLKLHYRKKSSNGSQTLIFFRSNSLKYVQITMNFVYVSHQKWQKRMK